MHPPLTLAAAGALAVATILAVTGCSSSSGDSALSPTPVPTNSSTITLTSGSVDDGSPLPVAFTCDGDGVSPALSWTGADDGETFALIVDDPDAPGQTFVHWIVANIPADVESVAEGETPAGGTALVNDGYSTEYEPPCPPSGMHRYRFTVYVLPSTLELGNGLRPRAAVDLITQAATAEATLTATYSRE